MPTQIVIEIAPEEQACLRAELRRPRRGRWLTLHILLLLALPYSPSEMAAVLLCARSPVYAVARDWQQGTALAGVNPCGWATLLYPFAPAQPAGAAEEIAYGLRWVPHALELRYLSLATATATATATTARYPFVGGNGTPLPACARLDRETSQARGQRQRPGAGRFPSI